MRDNRDVKPGAQRLGAPAPLGLGGIVGTARFGAPALPGLGDVTRKHVIRLLIAGAFVLSTGCQGLYLLAPDATEKIEAEYEIGEDSMAILVWADQSVRDEYPQVRNQICRSLTHHLRERLPDAKLIDARDVIDFQEDSGMDWTRLTNNEICAELECDYVLRVDLNEFTTRASNTPHLHKSRFDASLNLFGKSEREQIEALYQDEIRAIYPPDSKHGAYDVDERDLIHRTIEYFSQLAGRKFYPYEIRLEEKRS